MTRPSSKRALVIGGTGAVGRAVVAELRRSDIDTTFTYFQNATRATELHEALGATALKLDATDDHAVAAIALDGVDAIIYCAGKLEGTLDELYQLNARPLLSLSRAMQSANGDSGCHLLVVGGLDRAQSLPIPVAYAATQGMVSAMCMALAKELGPHARINMVALGLLDDGLSLGLDDAVRRDFLSYSGLRRFGSAAEAASSIVWLALHARYVSGRVIAVNGGI